MKAQRVSINEIRKRYAAGDIELSADITVKVNLSICPSEVEDEAGNNRVMASFIMNDEYETFGDLHPPDLDGWTPDILAKLFQIDLDDRIWEAEDYVDRAATEEMILRTLDEDSAE